MTHLTQQQNQNSAQFHDDRAFKMIEDELMKDDVDEQWVDVERYNTMFNDLHELLKDFEEQSPNTATPALAKPLEETLFNDIQFGEALDATHTRSNNIKLSSDLDNPLVSIRCKKYMHWDKEEHRLFLLGLEKYGQGDWSSISKYVVLTRSPTQVASHAQKYFLRNNAPKKGRKRRSIHDMTLQDIGMMVPHHIDQQNWVSPVPNFAMQPQEMQQAQYVLKFNLPSNMHHQMDGYEYFNNDPHHTDEQNWVSLAPNFAMQPLEMQQAQDMLQFNLPSNMHHQMGGYGYFNNDSHHIEHQNLVSCLDLIVQQFHRCNKHNTRCNSTSQKI